MKPHSTFEDEIKTIARFLYSEVRKDFPFFGCCGVIVGWLMIAQYRLKESGISPKEPWADALFSDFVSFNAFGLVFVSIIAIGALVTCLRVVQIHNTRLEEMVAHLQIRLAQLSSSIISFTLGLSIFCIAHSAFTITTGGAALAIMIVLFNFLIVIGFVVATLVARRHPPFDRWWLGSLMLILSFCASVWFIIRGIK